MSVLVLVETEVAGQGEPGLSVVAEETLTFARGLPGDAVDAVLVGHVGLPSERVLAQCREHGVRTLFVSTDAQLERYAARAWARVVDAGLQGSGAAYLIGGGTPRGNEVLAHVASFHDVPMAANVVQIVQSDPLEVERQVVGGAVLERIGLGGELAVASVAGHAVAPVPSAEPTQTQVEQVAVQLTPADLAAQVRRSEVREAGDTSALTGASVVVGVGRGVGGADRFTAAEALAERLGGAVGVSRVVTSLGWRPHHEQVGQTGSRISPDLYLACGISGAIQHWAGCASSRTIIAINTDDEAPMVTKAQYAVIGDMHEVLPALLEELG
ncbi:electron transfer flavoprotein subunit alpha/FixB family protein [Ornithinimicrobium pratense]|uniref:Electron transfer flavoprotein subunit alpha/FixB family protein n=1 Tax=Ornithinimicrobium pratense TaxID=2593973 RepID=A0A5J6V2K3_9MICO|nr:electron transfer flavoprotein subunit alpha/FixB family protein [Ornithinimicrobium pratense]QFG67907.1 electron transfer flavoprotein subunit alpha/FixB family protein [Ornithinimicrobium pratense]